MEKDAVLVCTVLGFLSSVAVTLGFVANNYSSKSVEYDGTNCVYRSPPAMGLGILGVFLVFINQVIVAAYASGWCLCLCCCCPCWTKRRRLAPTPSKRHRLGIILSIFSWVLTIVAMAMFIVGVTESSREEAPISKTPTSYACREPGTIGSFPTVSLSSLIAVVLGIVSYVLLETAAPSHSPPDGLFRLEVAGGATSTGQQQIQLQANGPTAGADQEAEHVSLATAV
ncbi:uncharacterized protein LOC119350110 [Triticum dicoccoides]|uniref:uncharacterized protein LOC119350110 n=1 Tax=Triticum dicoccoides TaxID=85692 RepID=UPI00188EC01E|nr:uncharacterized protein LOC119350110 [Triticum dicoccoides]